jgi:ribonuclease HII
MIDEEDEYKLAKIGVRDSKELTPAQREKMAVQIKKVAKDWVTVRITAKEIDELRKKKNLNIIEAEKMAEIIKLMKADKAYVDAPQV